jgi:alanine racemase/UDP-N-acetylmuramoyl-tripeptide--D-alanyl-D-alanine ligase
MPQMAILTSINENASTLPNKELIITEKCKLLQKVPLNYPVIAPCEIEGKIDNPLFISFNSPCSQLPHAKQIDSYSINHLNYQINYKDTSSHTLKWFNPFDGAIHLINAALKTSFILGLTKDHIVNLLQNYQSEPMQQEIFSVHQGPTFINCTYAQDPSSIINALKNAKRFNNGRLFFLFGGLKGIKVSLEEQLKKINWVFENSFVNKILPFEESNLEERLFDLQQTLAKDDTVIIQGMKKIPLEFLLKCLGDSIEGNRLTVNLSSICHNLKKLNLGQSFMAMVKANAYGTDSVILGKYLQSIGVNLLGVAHPDEGISLKRKAIKQDIFVIHSGLDEIKKIVQWDFEVGVSSYEMILALQKECENLNKKIKVHLHVDTGMTRLGCSLNECVDFAYAISNQQNLIFQGLMTHFACADSERQDDFTYLQIERFKTCIEKLKNKNLLPPFIHAANSSAAMRKLLPEGNLIRVGLGMYGISNLSQEELKTSLTLTSRIVAINYCKKGDTISYGRTYTVDRDTAKIAIIPLGYFDGLQRHFSGKSWFLVRGKKAFMVGIICMDFMMLDVSDIEGVEVGDMVLVFGIDCHGNCRNVEDFASEVGTCPHELITCLGPRIQRLFIEN